MISFLTKRDWFEINVLTQELQLFKKDFDIQYYDTSNNILEILQNQIENENPVLISVEYTGGIHALVAVGLEFNEKDEITKILCIDSSYDQPKITYWNSVIDLEMQYKGKYKFNRLNDDSLIIKLSDNIIFNKNDALLN